MRPHTSDCLSKCCSSFVTANHLSTLVSSRRVHHCTEQVLLDKQRLQKYHGVPKEAEVLSQIKQEKALDVSGSLKPVFLKHCHVLSTFFCVTNAPVIARSLLKMSSLLVAHGNRASAWLKKGKQRKQGLRVSIRRVFCQKKIVQKNHTLWRGK